MASITCPVRCKMVSGKLIAMPDFIENWLNQNLAKPDSIVPYRLRKTVGDVNSIHVQFVSPDGEGELFA